MTLEVNENDKRRYECLHRHHRDNSKNTYERVSTNVILVTWDDGTKEYYDDFNDLVWPAIDEPLGLNDETWKRVFGTRLKYLMWRSKYNQQEVAKAIGVSQGQLSNYITGRSVPSAIIINRLAKLFKVSVDQICGA